MPRGRSCSGCARPPEEGDAHRATLQAVSERAARTLTWEEGRPGAPLLDFALHHLTLSRAALYAAILGSPISYLPTAIAETTAAVDGLRRASAQEFIIRGLLTRAWLRFLEGKCTGAESAQSDLDEAWEIAERGPMKLFMADIHLHRARLFFREAQYPLGSAAADLAAARELIEKCGYWRRKGELADAEAAVRNRGPG